MQTPVNDFSIFTKVSRSAQASFWSSLEPLARNPSQGPSSRRVTPWIAPGLPHTQAGLRLSHSWQSLSRTAPRRLHYQAFGRTTAGLVPFGTRWWPHHKRGWCDLTRLQAPPMYNNGARKHRAIRVMQTSLNTRPKPRASA